ncbi:Sec-independent protein translocase subunit TatA/TatB [Elizabethkingia ursingii]|uniref:Sec-independent protein translocase subunit TatA/TatB n=1 Tax=Elizabethkingia ursingii TaxID=1756150 RepID=UPI002012D9C5|nr:twin-arginine translocase TatA/TatE family subunit [Elizabethkingia ursingii]MCL1672169.1 twin-arginine translocase TatA/TatE family subunit [Elizabethkingia ursingii]
MELSIGEMLVVALVIVVLFGPDKIPSIARELGQGVRKMKGAMEDIKTEIMKEADNPISDIKKEIDKVKQTVTDINPLNDVQKQIEDMKNSVNPMDQHTADTSSPEKTTETIAHTETEQIAAATADKKVDPLSDEHVGPVSR